MTDLVPAADLLLQGTGVIGNRALQGRGQVERQGHCKKDCADAGGDLDPALAAAEGAHPFGYPTPGEGEEQQWHRRADGERAHQHNCGKPD